MVERELGGSGERSKSDEKLALKPSLPRACYSDGLDTVAAACLCSVAWYAVAWYAARARHRS